MNLRQLGIQKVSSLFRQRKITPLELVDKTNPDTLIDILSNIQNSILDPIDLTQECEIFLIGKTGCHKFIDEMVGVYRDWDGTEISKIWGVHPRFFRYKQIKGIYDENKNNVYLILSECPSKIIKYLLEKDMNIKMLSIDDALIISFYK